MKIFVLHWLICGLLLFPSYSKADMEKNSVAAYIDEDAITLQQVDQTISDQVTRIHADLTNELLVATTAIVDDYLAKVAQTQSGHENDLSPQNSLQIDAILKEHRTSIDRQIKGQGPQIEFLKKRIAQRYAEVTQQQQVATLRASLTKQGKITIQLPAEHRLEQPLPPQTILAEVYGNPITAAQVEQNAKLKLYLLRGELYLTRKKAMTALIEQHMLEKAAKNSGITVNQLQSRWEHVQVNDLQVHRYIETQQRKGKTDLDPARIRPYLEYLERFKQRKDFLDGLKQRSHITHLLKRPESPVISVSNEMGNPLTKTKNSGAAADIYYFSNYHCKFCRYTQETIEQLIEQNPEITVIHLDFVPLIDTVSLEAAILAQCAAQQGRYSFIRKLLINTQPPQPGQPWFKANQLEKILTGNGFDMKLFSDCRNTVSTQGIIASETNETLRIGFSEPPSFVVHGIPLSGMQNIEDLQRYLGRRNDTEN